MRLRTIAALLFTAMLTGACGANGPGSGGDGPSSVSDSDPTTGTPEERVELVVTVSDPEGEPVEGAQVLPSSLEADGPAFGEMGRPTDASGQYRMQLLPGRYGIAVQYGTDVESEVQEIEIEAGEPASLDFVLDVDG